MGGRATHSRSRRLRTWAGALITSAAAVMLLAGVGGVSPVAAQLAFPARPKPPVRPQRSQEQMLVRAEEIHYDYTNERVSAVGNVQLYFGNSTLEADRVIYDQKTKRLHAEGNAQLTEGDGTVTRGEIMDLSDDYRDGFVDSLRLDAPEQTRFAAPRAERSGNFTVFHDGVYTACEPCVEDPTRPPKWQVKGARIIHDQTEKMIYFEDARLEFAGVPVAYIPY
ncbi:MAG: LPS-assembly protein LptD, partial [Alphaproteobacteria bacterium]